MEFPRLQVSSLFMSSPQLLVSGLSLLCAAASAGSPAIASNRLDRALDILEAKQRLRGSVTLSRDGEILYTRALGLRNGTEKVDDATIVRVGSITKVFTAALIYQLIDEGKLRLDTPLARFFPAIPNAKEITIAHLLAHASGLANLPSATDVRDLKSWVYRPQTKRQMLARFAAEKPVSRPGEKVAYSNPGYVLLGYIVEAVTKSTYDSQLQKRIARPLHMKRTRFGGAVQPAENEAHSYTFDDGHWSEQPESDMTVAGGAGAIVSTSADLTRFITALFGGRIISHGSIGEMLRPFSAELAGLERKGVVVSTLHRGLEKTIYSHLGGIDAFSSNLVYFPDDRVAVSITLNGQNYPMGKLFWLLVDTCYGRPITEPSFEPVVLPSEVLGTYTGVYSFARIGMDITIRRKGDQLSAQATGQEPFTIMAIGGAMFSDPDSGILIEFQKDAKDSVSSLTLYQGRSATNFARPGTD